MSKTTIKAEIDANITQNGEQAITGNILNSVLKDMIDATMTAGYKLVGVASLTTDPGIPSENVFYFATEVGDYPYFVSGGGTGNLSVADGEVAIFKFNGTSWSKEVMDIATQESVNQLNQKQTDIIARALVDLKNLKLDKDATSWKGLGGVIALALNSHNNRITRLADLLNEIRRKPATPNELKYIAASNSTLQDKAIADYVCDGTNDEYVLQTAINNMNSGTLVLLGGTYYINAFQNPNNGTPQAGLFINKSIHLMGAIDTTNGDNLVTIQVTQACYNAMDSNTEYSIIRAGTYSIYYRPYISNITFYIPDNKKKVNVLDCRWFGSAIIRKCHGRINSITETMIYGNDISFMDNAQATFFVGFRGSSNAYCLLDMCLAIGFFCAYDASGEHLMIMNSACVANVYGFRFNSDKAIVSGALCHPMILINCVDELYCNYPYFGENTLRQSIEIYNFHCEHYDNYFAKGGNYAKEHTPGQWFGCINYVIQNFDSTNPYFHKNSPEMKFWESGNGVNVQSKNEAQEYLCTTTQRVAFAPNYGQMVFDKTLNKVLWCIEPSTPKWVDANGNDI